jgi:hypothetical protein
MEKKILADTIGLSTPDELPATRFACIIGYSLAKREKQKVLLSAEPPHGEVVKGLTVQLDSEEAVEKVVERTKAVGGDVQILACDVHFLDDMDPANVKGWVVVYAGEREGLGKPGILDRMKWVRELEGLLGDAS